MKLHKFAFAPSPAAAVLALLATHAQAHDGHGLTGSHWHASDSWGFVALAALVAMAIWSSRKDK